MAAVAARLIAGSGSQKTNYMSFLKELTLNLEARANQLNWNQQQKVCSILREQLCVDENAGHRHSGYDLETLRLPIKLSYGQCNARHPVSECETLCHYTSISNLFAMPGTVYEHHILRCQLARAQKHKDHEPQSSPKGIPSVLLRVA